MRSGGRSALSLPIAAAVLLTAGGPALAASKHKTSPKPRPTATKIRPTQAQKEAQRMVNALQAQSRIQVKGTLKNQAGTTHILLRYQKSGREYEQETGPSFRNIVTTKGRMGGQWTISVGKTLWRSYDRKNWLKQRRAVAPAPLDTISLTPSGGPCCRPGIGVTVHDLGRSEGLIRLTYRNGLGPTLVSGTIYISPRSYLPVSYTVNSGRGAESLRGDFQLAYTGSFSIGPPK